ncbi:MAG: hypothetical protein AAFQ96_08025 [Pseudomonadota bacterium]
MSETRIISAAELFMKIGATPRTRSVRADQLFRKLRQADAKADTGPENPYAAAGQKHLRQKQLPQKQLPQKQPPRPAPTLQLNAAQKAARKSA